jgi:hypothetical protein
MNQLPVDQWKHISGTTSKVSKTWSDASIDNLPWLETYMTDEIPKEDSWDTFATKQKLHLENFYQELKVPRDGSLHYMSIRPKLSDGLENLIDPYQHLKFNYNFLKLTPGCQLMWHFDTFATFVRFNNISQDSIDKVSRTAVMLKDWDRGQVLQIGNSVYTHWQAGDSFTWQGYQWHGLCNFGPSDIVLAQITFLNNE